ncbi:MAG: hypothetical protein MRY64_14615 [Hyphomonadaceae bacterium]|nr:hypothetical protein [Hyphomonadaceae bacterium]
MQPTDLSDRLALPRTLPSMTALADPFSRVHPLFWPVLWVSLRAFVAWSGRLIEAGHGYASLSIHITWYGWIHVTHLDLSPERARLNRHMAGMEDEDWRTVLARARRRVEHLLVQAADTFSICDIASGLQSSPACGGGGRRSRSEGACGARYCYGHSPPSTRIRGPRPP